MRNIEKVSYRFSLLFKALLIVYPLIVICAWLGFNNSLTGWYFMTPHFPMNDIELSSIRVILKVYACLVDMIPTAIVTASFYYLMKLFQLYSRHIIFSYQNVILIRKIGYTLLWQVFAILLVQPFLSVILMWDAAPGEHFISVGFGNDELSNLIIGGIVIIVSWIMEEGRRLEEETMLTV